MYTGPANDEDVQIRQENESPVVQPFIEPEQEVVDVSSDEEERAVGVIRNSFTASQEVIKYYKDLLSTSRCQAVKLTREYFATWNIKAHNIKTFMRKKNQDNIQQAEKSKVNTRKQQYTALKKLDYYVQSHLTSPRICLLPWMLLMRLDSLTKLKNTKIFGETSIYQRRRQLIYFSLQKAMVKLMNDAISVHVSIAKLLFIC
ncbi:Hypothetical_protein [Hexamita inflata]|uniref:Hypothetical_protein n=1 Tax=Hexamita inflata TaxID=28002 RepID=A0AA86R297_9EUKA|nr:Hypothetical protein HINF_LOCUS58009 [Hexamita inflata]